MAKNYPPKIMRILVGVGGERIVDGIVVEKYLEAHGELWAVHRAYNRPDKWTVSHYRTGRSAAGCCSSMAGAVSAFRDRLGNLPAGSLEKTLAGVPVINAHWAPSTETTEG